MGRSHTRRRTRCWAKSPAALASRKIHRLLNRYPDAYFAVDQAGPGGDRTGWVVGMREADGTVVILGTGVY